MSLSYVAQVNHPSDIAIRNTVLLFKVSARKNPLFSLNSSLNLLKKKEGTGD